MSGGVGEWGWWAWLVVGCHRALRLVALPCPAPAASLRLHSLPAAIPPTRAPRRSPARPRRMRNPVRGPPAPQPALLPALRRARAERDKVAPAGKKVHLTRPLLTPCRLYTVGLQAYSRAERDKERERGRQGPAARRRRRRCRRPSGASESRARQSKPKLTLLLLLRRHRCPSRTPPPSHALERDSRRHNSRTPCRSPRRPRPPPPPPSPPPAQRSAAARCCACRGRGGSRRVGVGRRSSLL